jgi:hypothetical protein
MKIGEFFFEIGAKVDNYSVKDFAKTLMDMPLWAAGAIASLGGMQLGLMALTKHTLDTADSLNMFIAQTGESADELQRWQNVAKRVGVEGETVKSSMIGISNAITQVLRFASPGPAMALGRLGISNWAKMTPSEMLSTLRQKYQQAQDKNYFRELIGQIGVSPEMMRLFSLPPEKFNSYFNTRPAFGGGDLEAMAAFQASLGNLTITLERSVVPVLREILPYMGDVAKFLGILVEKLGSPTAKMVGEGARFGNAFFEHKLDEEYGDEKINAWFDKRFGPEPKSFSESILGKWLLDMFAGMSPSQAYPSGNATVNQNLSVTQHIHGVSDGADADHVGSRELQGELVRASKHFGRDR